MNRFPGVVFGEAFSQVARAIDIRIVGMSFASQGVYVEHPPSLPSASTDAVQSAFACLGEFANPNMRW